MYSSSSSEGPEDNDESFCSISTAEVYEFHNIKENDPDTTMLSWSGDMNMTDEELEELGRDIANNTHLKNVYLIGGALISFFFRGLTSSSSINVMHLDENGLSTAGLLSMVPFLQNANNLTYLNLNNNNFQSEGFNLLFRALCDSPIEILNCDNCGIGSIEIDRDHIPRYLTILRLNYNSINADGCRGLAKLLQGRNSTLTEIHLHNSNIDNERVAILVDALQNNTSLKMIDLSGNGISKEGQKLCLKLVNDVSSIKATLQSNNSLTCIRVEVLQSDE